MYMMSSFYIKIKSLRKKIKKSIFFIEDQNIFKNIFNILYIIFSLYFKIYYKIFLETL